MKNIDFPNVRFQYYRYERDCDSANTDRPSWIGRSMPTTICRGSDISQIVANVQCLAVTCHPKICGCVWKPLSHQQQSKSSPSASISDQP